MHTSTMRAVATIGLLFGLTSLATAQSVSSTSGGSDSAAKNPAKTGALPPSGGPSPTTQGKTYQTELGTLAEGQRASAKALAEEQEKHVGKFEASTKLAPKIKPDAGKKQLRAEQNRLKRELNAINEMQRVLHQQRLKDYEDADERNRAQSKRRVSREAGS